MGDFYVLLILFLLRKGIIQKRIAKKTVYYKRKKIIYENLYIKNCMWYNINNKCLTASKMI